ncbi:MULTISPECIES: glycosyltransferase family 2 protein [unclassified Flavobacterium]|uniref:glycosyltransferase family 2 protein n=1 Tax=unclassified Flavobacterium TaxID=196869 RepID=UPI001291E3CE|nr:MULTISPECIES: glycosyltransferase family 2 protein [unclassified Flavobacterium]MQP51537.1 glycosyltransferase [Flavobacterium sp. LMO9]MQP61235.1 glycosyltransferase [Flavobacterium sp. LMO6]
MKLSIVSPVYRAELVLDELVERISNNIPSAFSSFEIILVDDFSPDKSWDKIVAISNNNSNVRGFKLSRNFGQHYAITAGLNQTTGDYIVVLDCDLQDQPEEIEKLFKASQKGFDIVLARRYERKDSLYKKTVSKLFYKTLSYLTGTKQDATVANFGIYSRQVINEVVKLEEKIKYFPTMVKWVGFSTTYVNVEHASRSEGKSNYNLKKLLNLALDIILAYSDKPLRLIIKFGLSIALISFLMVIYVLFEKFTGKVSVSGYASLIISIWFLSGCLLTTLGVVGLYIGKIFEGVKNRPSYIIEKSTNE